MRETTVETHNAVLGDAMPEKHRSAVFYLVTAIFVCIDVLQLTITQAAIPGITPARYAGIAALGVFVLIVAFHRLTGKTKTASVILLAASYIAVVFAALKQGGAPAPTLAFAPFLPIVASVLLGWRAGIASFFISICALAFCAYAAASGLATPSPHSKNELLVLYTSASILIAGGATAYAIMYERLVNQAMRTANDAKAALETKAKELSESREFMSAVLESAHDAIIAADANGKLSLFNRAARELHGIGPQPMDCQDWPSTYSLFDADGKTPLKLENVPLFNAIQGHKVSGRDLAISVPGRDIRFMKANATPLYNDKGDLLGAVAIMRDVTTERLQETEIKTQNREIDQFARVASLDLQAPLNRIIMTSEALANSPEVKASAKARTDLAAVAAAASKIGSLIKDVLYMSRLPIGEIYLQPVIARDCIEAAIDLAGISEADCRLDFRFAGSPDVIADPQSLTRVFKNLIENVWKHAPPGARAHAEFTCVIEDNAAVLGVKDNGAGMSKEDIDKLFLPLERLQTDTQTDGAGLGLAICRKSLTRMGGEFWVESEPGEGCHFRLRLPLAESRTAIAS